MAQEIARTGTATGLSRDTRPSLTPRLRSLGTSTTTSRFGEDGGFDGVTEHFTPPTTISPEDARTARRDLALIEDCLRPIDRSRLVLRANVLLAHWFVPNMGESLAKGLLNDWVTDLSIFPEWAVEAAFGYWRRNETKKPTIAAIMARCRREIRKVESDRKIAQALVDVADKAGPTAPKSMADVVRAAVKPITPKPAGDATPREPKPEKPSAVVQPPSAEQIAEWSKAMGVQ